MEHQASELSELKRRAKRELGNLEGVQGFGVGDQRLFAYVLNSDSASKMPSSFQGVALETVITGEINAQTHDVKQ